MQSKGLKRKAVVVLLLGGCGVGSIAQGEGPPVVNVAANKVAQAEEEVLSSLAHENEADDRQRLSLRWLPGSVLVTNAAVVLLNGSVREYSPLWEIGLRLGVSL